MFCIEVHRSYLPSFFTAVACDGFISSQDSSAACCWIEVRLSFFTVACNEFSSKDSSAACCWIEVRLISPVASNKDYHQHLFFCIKLRCLIKYLERNSIGGFRPLFPRPKGFKGIQYCIPNRSENSECALKNSIFCFPDYFLEPID